MGFDTNGEESAGGIGGVEGLEEDVGRLEVEMGPGRIHGLHVGDGGGNVRSNLIKVRRSGRMISEEEGGYLQKEGPVVALVRVDEGMEGAVAAVLEGDSERRHANRLHGDDRWVLRDESEGVGQKWKRRW